MPVWCTVPSTHVYWKSAPKLACTHERTTHHTHTHTQQHAMANEHQTMEENALSLNTGNCHLRELKQWKVFILCYSFRHVSQRLQLSVTVLLKSRAMHYSSERVKIERTEQLSAAFFQHFFSHFWFFRNFNDTSHWLFKCLWISQFCLCGSKMIGSGSRSLAFFTGQSWFPSGYYSCFLILHYQL